MLPVAPAASARPGMAASRIDSLGSGGQDLDRIGPQEAILSATLGHPCPDSLPRHRMPHEDDATLVPGDAEPAVRDGADLDLDDRPDQRLTPSGGGPRPGIPVPTPNPGAIPPP